MLSARSTGTVFIGVSHRLMMWSNRQGSRSLFVPILLQLLLNEDTAPAYRYALGPLLPGKACGKSRGNKSDSSPAIRDLRKVRSASAYCQAIVGQRQP